MNVAGFLIPKMNTAFLYDEYSLRQGLEKMRHHGYTAIPVIDKEGRYLGTISEGDFLWCLIDEQEKDARDRPLNKTSLKNMEKRLIRSVLNLKKYPAVRITATMEQLFEQSMTQNFVPVVDDDDKYIGIVTRTTIIRYFYSHFPDYAKWEGDEEEARRG